MRTMLPLPSSTTSAPSMIPSSLPKPTLISFPLLVDFFDFFFFFFFQCFTYWKGKYIVDSEIKQDVLKTAIDALPFENYKSLKVLVEFCVKIAENESANMMGSRNLGIVFGPTVLRNRDPYVDFSNAAAHAQIFKTMVDFCPQLFD